MCGENKLNILINLFVYTSFYLWQHLGRGTSDKVFWFYVSLIRQFIFSSLTHLSIHIGHLSPQDDSLHPAGNLAAGEGRPLCLAEGRRLGDGPLGVQVHLDVRPGLAREVEDAARVVVQLVHQVLRGEGFCLLITYVVLGFFSVPEVCEQLLYKPFL